MQRQKKSLLMLKSVLPLICLSAIGCAGLPDTPEIMQCGFWQNLEKIEESSFICVSNKDPKVWEERALFDPKMKAAQAVSQEDFKAMNQYITELKKKLVDALGKIQGLGAVRP